MDPEQRSEYIRSTLASALATVHIAVVDESAKHAGHAGARSGGGHFDLTLVTMVFAGKSPVQRHRMVYDALGTAMQADIHALSIHAYTPDEFKLLT